MRQTNIEKKDSLRVLKYSIPSIVPENRLLATQANQKTYIRMKMTMGKDPFITLIYLRQNYFTDLIDRTKIIGRRNVAT